MVSLSVRPHTLILAWHANFAFLPLSLSPLLSLSRPRDVIHNLRSAPLQGSAKRRSTGCVNFVPAVACHFCFILPEKFSQPGAHYLSQPCRAVSAVKYGLSELRQGEGRLWRERERERMAGSTEISEEGQKVHKMGLERASPILKLALYLSRSMLAIWPRLRL